MEKINKVLMKLEEEGIDADFTENRISWVDDFQDTHFIEEKDIIVDSSRMVWFQSCESNKLHLFRIFEQGYNLNWEPFTNHSDWGVNCKFINYIEDSVVVIYKEKHKEFICAIKNTEIKVQAVYIEHAKIIDRVLYYRMPLHMQEHRGEIKRLSIPEIVVLDSILEADALQKGIELNGEIELN